MVEAISIIAAVLAAAAVLGISLLLVFGPIFYFITRFLGK